VDTAHSEIAWLQPYPDDPADVAVRRQHVRLALVAALQYLAPRQRAVLILREVLDWSAREVADALGTTVAAVNSALQRARATLRQPAADLAEPDDPHAKELLDGYVRAFERADAASLAELLTKDATWQMPPIAAWFAGRAEVVAFLHTRLTTPGAIRMTPMRANGQPAFALYAGGEPHAIHVLEVTTEGIASVVAFHDPQLFAAFGLPAVRARR
jgi:RNA polymerase sigma-70 factor (ECF subfamily)